MLGITSNFFFLLLYKFYKTTDMCTFFLGEKSEILLLKEFGGVITSGALVYHILRLLFTSIRTFDLKSIYRLKKKIHAKISA